MTETDPDYVVVGETRNYSFEAITKAIRFIAAGARFIATNPDATGPSVDGVLPATGAITALITKAIGKEPYIVGKPNPMMFRSALNRIGAHSENTGMIGDRMDTDIVAGIEAGLHTVLVLTGISDAAEIERYPFRPDEVLDSVADLLCGRADRGRTRWTSSDGRARRRRARGRAGCRNLARVARGEPSHLDGRLARAGSTRVGPRGRRLRGRDPAGAVLRLDRRAGAQLRRAHRRALVRAASPVERVGGDEQGPADPARGARAHGRGRHPRRRSREGERRVDGARQRRGPARARRSRGRPRRRPGRAGGWDAFPPSARKFGIGAIDAARRPETRAARIAKIVADAAAGKRPL